MRRAAAVLVAVGLIVGAVLVRRAMDDDDGGNGDGNGPRENERAVLVCAEELRAACESLTDLDVEIQVEDAADTASRLVLATTEPVLWAVPAPWPAIVDDQRVRAGLEALFADTAAVARTPIALLGPEELSGCDWRCIGDRVVAGDLDIGARSPASGLGTLQYGALAAGWFGGSDFATNDFDGAFSAWFDGVAAAATETDEPVTRLLQSRAFFDAALTFEAEAVAALDAASEDRKAGLALLYPSPMAYLDVVVVGDDPNDVSTGVGGVLREAGWLPPTDEPNGLPRAGVLVALRDLL